MKIAPYWARETFSGADKKGRTHAFAAYGWSFGSMDEAKADARRRAEKLFTLFTGGEELTTYADYLDRPVREEIIETLTHDGESIGLITRNRYGVLVLNTAKVAFVDVDFPAARPAGIRERVAWLFGPGKRQAKQTELEDRVGRDIEDWARRNPQSRFRLYRTCAGYRLLLTHQFYEPTSEATRRLLDELGSDQLYRRLTFKQECFRARLTPKPWRCNCRRPKTAYPWRNAEEERAYRDWERNYQRAAAGYTTCRMVREFGGPATEAVIQKIIAVHDQWTCGSEQRTLA